MSSLVCYECGQGTLIWVDYPNETLDSDMRCKNCGRIYHGMGAYIEAAKQGYK